MMLEERETDSEDFAEQRKTVEDVEVECIRGLRWVKLADKVERSLQWLIPAATLAYLVFRILPLLGS